MAKCEFPNCVMTAQANGFCVGHASFAAFKSVKVPKKKEKKSDTRKDEEKEYKKIVKEMFASSVLCELKVPGVCTKMAEGLHHQAKRGANYLNKKYLKRACNACNRWAEDHPKEAIELGISVSKFEPDVIIAEDDPEVKAIIVQ